MSLEVVTLQAKEVNAGEHSRQKALLVFGEHARELVSSESGLDFVRNLCGLGALDADRVRKALARTDFVLVPNANPLGRRLVENGAFCKRTNEHGVDLNRNWGDDHRDEFSGWMSAASITAGADDNDAGGGSELNPGEHGFSEPETQILLALAEEVSPKLFLSVHSGTYLLGMPFGFSENEQAPHANQMLQILSSLNEQHFGGGCPFGGIASVIGYHSNGCSIDYVTEHLHVPFAFTFEIYADSRYAAQPTFTAQTKDNSRAAGDADALFRKNHSALDAFFKGSPSFLQHGQSQTQSNSSGTDNATQQSQHSRNEDCLAQFNPLDGRVLGQVLQAWTGAYLDLAEQTAAAQLDGSNVVSPVAPVMHNDGGLGALSGNVAAYTALNHAQETLAASEADSHVSWDALHEGNPWRFLQPTEHNR